MEQEQEAGPAAEQKNKMTLTLEKTASTNFGKHSDEISSLKKTFTSNIILNNEVKIMTQDFSVSHESAVDKMQMTDKKLTWINQKDPDIYDSDANSSNNDVETVKKHLN